MDTLTLAAGIVADRSATFTATVIVAGLGIVLATLMVLILVFYAFGSVVSKSQAKTKKNEAKKVQNAMEADLSNASAATPAPVQASAPAPAPVVEEGISGEVIAAISAAVYSMEGSSAVIRSVTRKTSPITTRNPWAQAAVMDNTRPF